MFTHFLPESNEIFRVVFTDFAEKHFLKDFEKKYKGIQWDITLDSIRQDFARLAIPDNKTQYSQQIKELRHKESLWIVKYEFRIAGTKNSAKASGNRCVAVLDTKKMLCQILYIYHKNHLPKGQQETVHINQILKTEYPEIVGLFL